MNIFQKVSLTNKMDISPRRQILIVYVFLTIITLAVFWQVSHFDFINFDDDFYITKNFHIQSGITLNGLRWAFITTYADLWHPLIWLSFMFDYQLYGQNPGGYHVTNLILHILSTLLLFRLFNRMTGTIWKSAFVAAFFALHPLHVESVAWVAERKDVLSAFFWMLTLCLYVYYTEKPAVRRYLLVLFSFILALMSKPMVITLPAIMILLDYWPLKRFESKKENYLLWQLKEKLPLFILSTVIVIITFGTPGHLDSTEFPIYSRLANAPVSFVTYLFKTFWPHDLAVYYTFSEQLPVPQVGATLLFILIISIAIIVAVKRLPHLFVGWLWYSIAIFPAIGIVQIGNHAMANRYTYLPLIGIGIILAWGIPLLFKDQDVRKKILFPVGIAALLILAVFSWKQCSYWKNSITLFNHALQVTKNNYLMHSCLANTLVKEGKIEEAIDHFNKAIYLTPNYADNYNNRGNAYAKLGQYQKAIEDYNKAIILKPYYADAYCNRGSAYAKLGEHNRAIVNYEEAIRLKPDLAHAYYNGGLAYAKLRRYQLAVEEYSKAIQLKPDYAKAYNNRGTAYGELGEYQLAIENFNEAIRLQPDYIAAYTNGGIAYFRNGNNNLGCRYIRKACEFGDCKLLEIEKRNGLCR